MKPGDRIVYRGLLPGKVLSCEKVEGLGQIVLIELDAAPACACGENHGARILTKRETLTEVN